jgi:hypothetical protein
MKAEALHKAVEALQDGPSLDDSVDLPERIQNAAQAALDASETIPDSCGTGTGTARANQIAENDVQVNDLLTRGGDDRTPIPAYLNSHAEDATTSDPPTEWGEDEWQSCGNAGLARWGWYGDWFKEKANELSRKRGEDEPYESMANAQGGDSGTEIPDAEALKDVAGVSFEGTATGQLDESELPNEGYESHYLYPADTKSESSYPVVDAEGNLRRGNVDAAWSLGARGDADEDTHDERLLELAMEFENPPEWAMDDAESMADIGDVSEDTLVTWDSSGDRNAYGMIVDIREEGEEPLDGEIDGDQTINPPAALIEVHQPTEDGWEATDTMVGHTLNTDTLEVIDELPDPESLSKHEDSMADVPEKYKFNNPGEAVEMAQEMGLEGPGDEITHTHGEGDNTVFMPGASHQDLLDMLREMGEIQSDDGQDESMAPSSVVADSDIETMSERNHIEKAVLDAADSVDKPVEALKEYAATEQPTIVEQSEYESLNSRVEALENMMADRLVEDTGLREATVESMSFEAMAKEFETDDGDFDAEALVQNPETGEPSASEGAEALSDDADVDKAEALYNDYQMMTNPPEGLEEDITEALGVSDFDDAIEVLD